jgi:hypothetical protein
MANRATAEERIISFFSEHSRDEVGAAIFNVVRGIMRKPMVTKRLPGRPRKATYVQSETPEV